MRNDTKEAISLGFEGKYAISPRQVGIINDLFTPQPAEIERMRKYAEANEEADRRRKELADARNEADSLIYNTEKLLKDLGDKVTASEKVQV
ncbi:Hsp70 family protein, partial [Acetomicrobium sp. S15 = DSM 107314]|uniref:Hsp70 family protein n=1 Tax=Acetomicrobium sp. S15 = DSM 107314 TaxID=2529858 RepID=UPI0031589D6D